MVKLNDIATLADSLSRPALAIEQLRCVQVRNRNASCKRCMDVCAASALQMAGNELEYTPSLCVNCGACAAVCPNEALVMLEPTKDELANRLREMAQRFARDDELRAQPLVVVCARVAARVRGRTELLVEVPCLGHIDTSLLLEAATHHQSGIVLVDGDCASCKLGFCSKQVDTIVADACGLLRAAASETIGKDHQFITRSSTLPAYALRVSEDGGAQATRRHFFSSAADEVKQTVLTAARTTLEERFGTPGVSVIEQLKLRENGTMLQFDMLRHLCALDALDAFCPPADASFSSPLFAGVEIDTERCTSCGMCVVFCPTGALSRGDSLPHTRTAARLDFLACECSACGLCADVCFKKCLTLRSDLTADELFSFEPRTFKLGKSIH